MTATGKISLEQLAKDIKSCKKLIQKVCLPIIEEAELFINEVNEPLEPELIQGYTAENWQEIIDGGYLCEFSLVPFNTPGHVRLGQLEKMGDWGFLQVGHSAVDDWSFCRPARIKGVMRPIFVEPVGSATKEVIFFNTPYSGLKAACHTHGKFWHRKSEHEDATSYIEL